MTRTWPSQCGPAPMPMVGMGTCSVIRAARLLGMHSRTTANRPGGGNGLGIGEDLLARALDLVAAQPSDGLRLESDVSHHRNPCVDQGPDRGRHAGTPLQLDGLAVRLLEEPAGRAEGLSRRDLVAEEWQVRHDQRTPRGPRDHLRVVDDLVEGDPEGRLPALDHGPQRIADQQAIDAGPIEQPGRGEVVGRQHADPAPLRLPRREIRDCHRPDVSGHADASRQRPGPR